MWLALLLWLGPVAGAATIRADLKAPLSPLICNAATLPSMLSLWLAGIQDTGVRLYLLDLQEKKADPLGQLAEIASGFAAEAAHNGMAFGACDSQRYWIATTPAPFPLAVDREKLDIARLLQYCTWFRLDYANALGGQPRLIFDSTWQTATSAQVHSELLPRGTLGLTCKPKQAAELGPILWSLTAVKKGPLPAEGVLPSSGEDWPAALAAWVNDKRRGMGLKPLKVEMTRHKALIQPLITKNLTTLHQQQDLRQVSLAFAKEKGKFIGENRIQAANFDEAAWLLWNSPRHRSLLLDAKATHLMTLSKRLKSQALAVMVFAKF